MRHRPGILLALLLALAAMLGVAVPATAQPGRAKRVQISTAWNVGAAAPGQQVALAVILDIAPGWHINPDKPRLSPDFSTAIPLDVSPATPPGVTAGEPQYPEPRTVEVNYGVPLRVPVYQGRAIAYVPMTIAADAKPGTLEILITVKYGACNDRAGEPPRSENLTATLTIAAQSTPTTAPAELFAGYTDPVATTQAATTRPVTTQPASTEAPTTRPKSSDVAFHFFGSDFSVNAGSVLGVVTILLLGMLGGALLNFTPCVLPVIPIKVLSLSQSAGSRGRLFQLGLAMSLGIISFWMGMGVLVVIFKAFASTNIIFQNPIATVVIGLFIAVMAIGMCGLFSIRLPQFIYAINPGHDSIAGSLGIGVMTAILSTPCTAPFMGSALAATTALSVTQSLLIFLSIGVGMALPYLILTSDPALTKKMPRTGPASELIKQEMGLLLLAAAAYFVGVGVTGLVKKPDEPASPLYWLPVMFFIAAAGVWLIVRTWKISHSMVRRAVFSLIGLVFLGAAAYGAVKTQEPPPFQWAYFSPSRFERARADGNVIVLDFTAEWCLNCKVIEKAVLERPEVFDALGQRGVAAMKVDLTGDNPAGNKLLNDHNRDTIPFLVIIDVHGREVFTSDAYTAGQVVDAIERAKQP